MLPVGFEPAIPASDRPQTHATDQAAAGIGTIFYHSNHYSVWGKGKGKKAKFSLEQAMKAQRFSRFPYTQANTR